MAEIFYHTFDPVYDNHSRVLILGSFPSVKSREQGFYYGHPQNRFWKVLSAVFSSPVPQSIDEKKKLLLDNGVALWDVAQSCEINGSSDSSMKNVRPNDIYTLLYTTGIDRVFANGKTAARLYERFILPQTNVPITALPSTSPANAAFSLDDLCERCRVICLYQRPDLLRQKIIEYSGGKKYCPFGRVDFGKPFRIIQIAGNIFLTVSGGQ